MKTNVAPLLLGGEPTAIPNSPEAAYFHSWSVGYRGDGTAEGEEELSGNVGCNLSNNLLWGGWLKEPFVVMWKTIGNVGPVFDSVVPPFRGKRGLVPKETAHPFYECLD